MAQTTDIDILTTVNAPFEKKLNGHELSEAIRQGRYTLGQVSSFFTEICQDRRHAFARRHGLEVETLTRVASEFEEWFGQPLLI